LLVKRKRVNGKSAKLMVYKNSGKAVDFRNSQQDALKPLSRLSFLTEIGRRFHMAGPQTKNELAVEVSEWRGICKTRVRSEWPTCNRSLR
jgi:hypothetical protein